MNSKKSHHKKITPFLLQLPHWTYSNIFIFFWPPGLPPGREWELASGSHGCPGILCSLAVKKQGRRRSNTGFHDSHRIFPGPERLSIWSPKVEKTPHSGNYLISCLVIHFFPCLPWSGVWGGSGVWAWDSLLIFPQDICFKHTFLIKWTIWSHRRLFCARNFRRKSYARNVRNKSLLT